MRNKKILISVLTSLICILAPVSVPIGAIPVTLILFVLYVIILIEDLKVGILSVLLYLLMGSVGLPVFSGFQAGFGVLLGPSGGFIIGYLPMMAIAGWLKRYNEVIALMVGTIVLYICGSVWFSFIYDANIKYILWSTVIPFIPIDIVKIIIALRVAPKIKAQLIKAKLY